MKLDDVIAQLGGGSRVAKHLKITRQAVSQWPRIPGDHVLPLVELSAGSLTAEQLLAARRATDEPDA